jgi:hypothetical protein
MSLQCLRIMALGQIARLDPLAAERIAVAERE